jgi:hypothetical protein
MESIQNQQLKGIKPKTEIEWIQNVTKSSKNRMESNRKLIQNGIKPKQRVETYQTENRNRMESIQNQQLKGIKPKTEIEWNQTVTKNCNVSNRKPK